MTQESPAVPSASNDMAALVRQLAAAEAALQAHLAGQVDAIVGQDGQPLLLHAAQQRLLASEDAQRQQAERQTAILDALPSHIALVDDAGVIIAVNMAWRQFSETNGLLNPAFGLGENYLTVCDLAWGNAVEEARAVAVGLRQVLDGEIAKISREYRCDSPAECRWFLLTITPLNAGHRSGAVIAHTDITERKTAVLALQSSEAHFRALIEHSTDGISLIDASNRICYLSPAVAAIEGYTSEELLGRQGLENTHPDDVPLVLQTARDLLAKPGTPLPVLWRRRHKDGHWLWLEGVATNLLDDPVVRAIVTNYRDVTERKQAETRIAEQAALLDGARDAISVRDLEHRTTYLNKSAERMYGWSAAEALGRSVRELVYQDPTAFDQAMRDVVEHGGWIGELTPTSKDGRLLLIETRWTLVRDSAGLPHSILSICNDITERRKLEQQFLRAQRLESIGTLAGGIAHDLNNVLTPILLSISLLTKGETDEKRLRILTIIDSSAQRGADMVKQVLSFARGVEGQRLPVQMPDLLHDLEKIINDTFLKSIQVRVVIQPDIWSVIGDVTQLHQVLLNLCVNARDAMPNGGALTLSAENLLLDEHYAKLFIEAKPGPFVVVRVEDTGTGIPPDIIEKIFEPFFTTKELGKGTGLGLSTSLAVVKSHGGFLRVYSEPGTGTTFKLYLPAMVASPSGLRTREEPSLPRGHGELVLVVDDEEAVRQITHQTLEAFGYRVLLAADGTEALAHYAMHQRDIAVVLTDMMMPVMDGNAVIRVLLKMRPDVRIIAASGLHENHVVAKAISSGVKLFLSKPYSAESLLIKIREALKPEG